MLDKLTEGIKSFGTGLDKTIDNFKDKLVLQGTKSVVVQTKQFEADSSHRRRRADDAAANEADLLAVLQQLNPGYATAGFDPVQHELEKLSAEAHQDDIDCLVEKLSTSVEIVSKTLTRHVVLNHDKLIDGITAVTNVEDDLKACYVVCHGAKTTVSASADDLARNIQVAKQTRKKQGYMELLDICLKVKQAKDLQKMLKVAQEAGEYGEAILLCVECFQGVDTLQHLSVSHELKMTVQRLYIETISRLDMALQNVCANFVPEEYGKVLEGYMLQGISGNALADKVLDCFKDAIHDHSVRVVRSMLITQPGLMDAIANSGGESSFADMCRLVPPELVRPCLLQMMEVTWDLMASHHNMTAWHQAGVDQQVVRRGHTRTTSMSEPLHSSSPTAGEGEPHSDQHDQDGSSAEERSAAEAATRQFLGAVAQMLSQSRPAVWESSSRRVRDLLSSEKQLKGEDFISIVDACQRFLTAGEGFSGRPSELRGTIMALCSSFFESHHRSNLDSLQTLLAQERWQSITAPADTPSIDKVLKDAAEGLPAVEAGGMVDFGQLVAAGNPFKRAGKKKKAAAAATGARAASGGGSPVPALPPAAPAAQAPAKEAAEAAASTTGRLATVSSLQVLKWLRSYSQLLRSLQPRADAILHGLCEMFDAYLLHTFLLFSGVSLEELVWYDTKVVNRLRSTLLRILTQDTCKYKAQVEDLQRRKPAPGDVAASLKEAFTVSPEFKLNMDKFTSKLADKFKDTFDIKAAGGPGGAPGSPSHRPPAATPAGSVAGPSPAAAFMRAADGSSPTPFTGPTAPAATQRSLRERIVAVESLAAIGDELKEARASLQACLPARLHKELDSYLSRTVDATQDLKEVIFRGGARGMLQAMLDPERGTAVQIGATNYGLKDHATSYSPWAQEMQRHFAAFKDALGAASLPDALKAQMWENAIATGGEAVLEGLARASRRCTIEGRAAMSLDLSYVEKALRGVVPPGTRVSLRAVDNYIKAFYIPWQELEHWCQIHLPEYGKAKILALVDAVAEAYKVKRAQKKELLAAIDADLAEYA